MRFRRLKLSGFKSFVEPADLAIEGGLTGIVGPNGCGKSNLLEAIRWVMGEGSPKSLRGGGMEDVIFAGTATRPARDFAEVSLLVEREPGDEGGEAGESEVTRRIERGAGSAYRIDGRDVRQKDVSLLFADAATGAHSPALVSQGRIGAVIAARPVERRLLLEEAAGISGLHARRKDAEGKLRAAEANIERLDELMAEQEARSAALRRQARAAERYRALTDKIRLSEARLVFARWAEADRAAASAAAEAEAAAGSVVRLQEAVRAAEALQERAAAVLGERRDAAVEARDSGRSLAHDLATARARHDTVKRRLSDLERAAMALAAERAREMALRDDAERAIATLEDERNAIEARLAQAEGVAARIAGELGTAEEKSREAEASLAALLAREAAMRAERRVAEAALDSARAQQTRISNEVDRLGSQQRALASSDEAQQQLAEARKAAEKSAADFASAESSLQAAEQARAVAAEGRDAAESDLASARAALAAASSERDALARTLEQSGGAALALVRAAKGYERALAAALGDDLDAAIGGESNRRWQGSEGGDDPPLAPGLEPLLGHVEAPPELRRRLAQVGVADLDNGQPLAVGQRLVTRDGAMRRWDGFVAIGAGAAAAERLLRANRLAELASALPDLERAVTQSAERRDSAARAVEAHRLAAESARSEATLAERAGREAARAADIAAGAIERIEAQHLQYAERLKDLDPLIAAADESVAAAEAALAALPDASLLSGEVDSARRAAQSAGEAVAEARAAAATRARETAADRERHAAAGKEQADWRERLAKAEQRLAEAEQRGAAHTVEVRGLEAEPAMLTDEIGRLERASADCESRVAATAAAERDAQEAAAVAGKAMAEAAEAFALARESRAGAIARAEAQAARRADFAAQCGEMFECPPPLLPERMGFEGNEPIDPDRQKEALDRLTLERDRIGPVNLVAESELAELEQDRTSAAAERDELGQAINRLRGSIGSLNREGRVRLLDAFGKVDSHFRSLFSTLFGGGEAHLELVESDDPLEAGLEIMAQPPGKRLSALTLLSGGEQALTAVALIFALFLTNPAPICVLDEVDAPLDDANVDRFCDLLDRMTAETDTRYLIVTHNAVTMARMHRLYGVTMIERGVSRLVSVDLGGAEQLLAAE